MSIPTPQDPDAAPDQFDETVPPRPEEEVADAARSVPDRAGHGGSPAEPDAGDAVDRGTAGPAA